jgi:hypothetical protein
VALAAEHAQRLRLGTAVALAIPFLNLTYEPAAKKIDWPRLIQELAA